MTKIYDFYIKKRVKRNNAIVITTSIMSVVTDVLTYTNICEIIILDF